MDFTFHEACPLCGNSQVMQIYKTHDRHYGIKGDYTIYQCNSCELVFLNPMPTPEYLSTLYPKTYYSYQSFADKPSLVKFFLRKMLINVGTKDPKFKTAGIVLDIGCGSGKFLYKMREQGWKVYGVEISEDAARLGNSMGLNIHAGDLMSAKFENEQFDYVRLNHSFEHIHNPREVLDEIRRILKKDGKLMIGVPNIDSFNARIFKKYWWYLGAPVHTFNYSVKTLSLLLQQHQFKTEKVTYNSDHGGNLGSLQIYLNRKNGRLSEEGFLLKNMPLRILAFKIAKLMDLFRKGDAIEITAVKA